MRFLFITILVFCVTITFSQEVPAIKFGKISVADLKNTSYSIDTGAHAVVLADFGSTQIKGNKKGSVSLEFKQLRRIHILKNSAYGLATIEILLHKVGELEEQIDELRATTYNLENGKIVESKLDVKNSVFKDKIDKNWVVKKFTFPNVKEGSIIEYEFRLTSDFLFNMQPWVFQSEIPHLWSQYMVSLPSFLSYRGITQGDLNFYRKEQKDREGSYIVDIERKVDYAGSVKERIEIACGISDFSWTKKDVQAMKEEPYTSSVKNYVDRIEFQLAGYTDPFPEQKVMTTWPAMTTDMLSWEDFGLQLDASSPWLGTLVKPLIQDASTGAEKAKRIYNYVKNNFTCTSLSQLFTEQTLKQIAEKKSGGVAEINLLLTAMCRNAGLSADPVILSTRSHGFVYEKYPVLSRFNYVVCRVKVDGKEILLDAARPAMGFGKLHYDCYNGQARVVNQNADIINLKPDQLTEQKKTSVLIMNDGAGKWTGQVHKLYGYYASTDVRRKISSDGIEAYEKELKAAYGNNYRIDSTRVDSLLNMEQPVTTHFRIKSENDNADILYMNAIMADHLVENPFKSPERNYPVEMYYKLQELYSLNMQVPGGYVVEELPKTVAIKGDGLDVLFEYKTSATATNVLVNYKLEINQTFFQLSEYISLREFFSNVIAKMQEQVVFKKKSK